VPLEKIDISNLLKARDKFEKFRIDMVSDRDKAGAVQAFEYCYELTWKILKKILGQRGIDTGSPKTTFRAAALDKLIDDPELWFDFQQKRNLTTHTYDEENMEAVLSCFDAFSKELSKLIERLGD
jgi:nucleotidyltransferase substrate binding protein (TIGR01987 family)